MDQLTLYKVLDEDGRSMHGGTGHWTPGRWREAAKERDS